MIDKVEAALLADDWEASAAALGPDDPTDVRWLSMLCAVHELAARNNLRLTVVDRLRPEEAARAGAIRDRAEAWLSTHAAAKVATRRPSGEAPLGRDNNPAGREMGCPWGCYVRTLPTVPPKDYCVRPCDGEIFERRTKAKQ